MGSPPPAGSKKVVLKFRSVSSIVMPPASTGRASTNKKAVNSIAHMNRGVRYIVMPFVRMFSIVVRKFMELSMEDIPARCSLNITRSTPPPECVWMFDSGG